MTTESAYQDWYVLQVMAGRERFIKQVLERVTLPKPETIVFSREIIHKNGDHDLRLVVPLFPGYIFIHKAVNQAAACLRKRLHREFIRPVAFDNKPAAVAVDEMRQLLTGADDEGKFQLSVCHDAGEEIVICRGPLMNMKGNILFINRKKRKAKVRFKLFQREMDISLGLDFLEQVKSCPG